MKYLLTILAIVAFSLTSYADDFEGVLTVKMKEGEKSQQMQFLVSGQKMVLEQQGTRFILDSGSGDVFIIANNNGTQSVIQLDLNVINAMGGISTLSGAGNFGIDSDEDVQLTKTGKKESINGYNCQQYLTKDDKHETLVWVADNFPYDFSNFLSIFSLDKSLAGVEQPFPMRGEVKELATGKMMTYDLVVEKKAIEADKFSYPAGAQVMDLRAMMQQMMKTSSPEQLRQMFQNMMPKK